MQPWQEQLAPNGQDSTQDSAAEQSVSHWEPEHVRSQVEPALHRMVQEAVLQVMPQVAFS